LPITPVTARKKRTKLASKSEGKVTAVLLLLSL
jgi:hypothetical protein